MCKCITRRRTLGLLAALAVLPVAGCFEGKLTGPEQVHWDRDTCEACQMMISDAGFTTQIRGGPKRRLYKFDDIGGAVNWLNKKSWAGNDETEIWIADVTSTREKVIWLKARDAFYFKGEMTPMNYGYSARADARPDSIDFVAMTNDILTNAPNHIRAVPQGSGS